jgi:hypothetical protein
VLGIYSDRPENILHAIERIMNKLIEAADEEKSGKVRDMGPDNGQIGKEHGEYIFRLSITKKTAGLLIGSGGANIKALRQESGAKVFVENESQQGHRLVRVIGAYEGIMRALDGLHRYVQQDADTEEFHSVYAAIINFGEFERNGNYIEDNHHRTNDSWRNSKSSYSKEDRPSSSSAAARAIPEALDLLADGIRDMPPHLPNLQYALSFEIPAAHSEDLREYAVDVMKETATQITIEEQIEDRCQALIVGTLAWCYAANALMIKRLTRLEEEASRPPTSQDPAELHKQILEMQEKLNRLQKSSGM